MRLLVALACCVLLAPAMAHGPGEPVLTPLRPVAAEVAPDDGPGWRLQTAGGDLEAGDRMLFTIEVFDAPVTASLWVDGTKVRAWDLPPGLHHVGRLADQDGTWSLDLDAASAARAVVTWDLACACPSKVVTPETPGVAAAFLYTADADGTWHVTVPEPPLQKWQVAAYRMPEGALAYPDDMERVARSEVPAATYQGAPAHELDWPAVAGETTYLVVTSREADEAGYLRAGAIDGREQSRAEPQATLETQDTPLSPVLALLAVLAVALLRRR